MTIVAIFEGEVHSKISFNLHKESRAIFIPRLTKRIPWFLLQ